MKLFHAERYPVTNRQDKLELVGNTIPILIMEGSHESQIEILAAYELHKRIPNSEFIINMECYHAAPREHPELFNSRVHEWLKRNAL